jgi:hypothetical protein
MIPAIWCSAGENSAASGGRFGRFVSVDGIAAQIRNLTYRIVALSRLSRFSSSLMYSNTRLLFLLLFHWKL